MDDNTPELEEFPLVPTVKIESGDFSGDVIQLYEMPYKQVMKALGGESNNGPDQMERMLHVFKLAVMDQSKLDVLEFMSFTEMADLLSQWTMKSSAPTPERMIEKMAELKHLESNAEEELAGALDLEVGGEELTELLSLLEALQDGETKPVKRGRHVADPPLRVVRLEKPLNDPGDGISPF
jgi:hypothetical protein